MDTYEASYVAGVTAGMKVAKLKEKKKIPAKSFDEKKNVKLGYVAAEANDDAHADINAYYLGVKAVCKKVVLQVEYIDAWNNSDAEATAAGDRSGAGVWFLHPIPIWMLLCRWLKMQKKEENAYTRLEETLICVRWQERPR